MQMVTDFLLGHPDWVHWLLLIAEAGATTAVGLGIIWESPHPIIFWEAPRYKPDRTRLAHKLVIWGIAFETLFSVSLFVFDEAVSHRQQAKIIELEQKIAPRELSPEQRKAIGAALAKFRDEQIVVRSYGLDPETTKLAWDIGLALNAAGIKPGVETLFAPRPESLEITGRLRTGVHVGGPISKSVVINGIANALRDLGKLSNVTLSAPPSMEWNATGPIFVEVGPKPIPGYPL